MATRLAAEFSVASETGSEREAARLVEDALRLYALPPVQIERIKTAVCEAVLNAIEHGNDNLPYLPVHIQVEVGEECITISVYDHGLVRTLPETPVEPDLAAKLAGEQRPRGWGMYLIRKMVDELTVSSNPSRHCVEMVFDRESL